MIGTVTPNPSIDRTVRVVRLARGELNRASSSTSEAAGKGLNVARALHLHSVQTVAVLPLAAETAPAYLALLADAVPIVRVPIGGAVRTNLTILEADGTVTKVNEAGPEVGERDVDALLAAVDAIAADWVVGCGSLPPGAAPDFFARVVRLGSPERRVAIDSSGDALRYGVAARPDLIKPNLSELEELVDDRLETLGEVVDAAGSLVGKGVGAVLVSLGVGGAVYVDRARAVHAEANAERVMNTVGAGDALLAGYLAAGGGPEALRTAIAWSVAAIATAGTGMRAVTGADAATVHVHEEVDRRRRTRPELLATSR